MIPTVRRSLSAFEQLGQSVSAAAGAGLLAPGLAAATAASLSFWGPTPAASYAAAALRYPSRTAIVDDHGAVSYRSLHRCTDQIAASLQRSGVGEGSVVGLLCRNHRGFVQANIAIAKLGGRVVYLNTGLPEPQLAAIVEREGIELVIADVEFAAHFAATTADVVPVAPELNPRWCFPSLEPGRQLFRLPTPFLGADPVLLTSGTTGTPKGARRPLRVSDAGGAVSMLASLPYRRGDTMVIAAPLFHAWGLSQHILAAALAGTVVLRSRFDAEQVLADTIDHGADTLVVVPVMIARMLAGDTDETLPARVRAVACSGAALPAALATEWMDRHGDTLYNFYGSTEVGQVSIARPDDLRKAPGTAGRAAPGIDLRIVDDVGHTVPVGETGRIVVAGSATFAGYTGGGSKPVDGDHMEIGDLGHLDQQGRLFVDARVDDMIISGGENLYPGGIEAALLEHPSVADVAVVGVPDGDLGQRVRAVVVASGKRPTTAALKKHAKTRLASYEVPREFMFVDDLPRNSAGKVLRRELIN